MPTVLPRREPRDPKRHFPHLPERLSSCRFGQKLTLQEAAAAAGVSIPTWRDAECFGLATTSTLALIAKSLRVPAVMLTGASAPEPESADSRANRSDLAHISEPLLRVLAEIEARQSNRRRGGR